VNIYARTIRYFRPFLWATAGGVALTLANIGFNLLKPWPFKFIVDGVLADLGEGRRAVAGVVS
jgi:hypothetical protein